MADPVEASSCLHAAWNCHTAIPFQCFRAAAICLPLLAIGSKVDLAIQLGLDILNLLPTVDAEALDPNNTIMHILNIHVLKKPYIAFFAGHVVYGGRWPRMLLYVIFPPA